MAHGAAADSPVVERFLQRPSELHTYDATRHLEAGALGRRGWADARTRYSPADGFTYEIVASGGTGFIVNRVLRSLLDREKEAIETGDSAKSAVDPTNYDLAEGPPEPEGLARILMRPKRREETLIEGSMLVAAGSGLPVRLEGKLAKNPSFWVKRADIVRSYATIAGATVPVRLESTANIRIFGKSTLTMTYTYSSIDGRSVSE